MQPGSTPCGTTVLRIHEHKTFFNQPHVVFKIFAFAFMLFAAVAMQAQAPAISKNMGFPTGNASCNGVAYGNGVYVAVLSAGYIYSSPDGETWSKTADPALSTTTLSSISFGAGVFVVSGNNGLLMSSPDGQTWTTRTSSTTQNLTCVQFLQGAFYATGMNATLRRSADGITWSSISIGAGTATDMFLYITSGNGTLVMSARKTTGSGILVYKSTTGLSNSWTYQDLGFGTVNRVQYINDRFFVFQAGHQIMTSTNASTWTDITASITLALPNATMGTWNSSNQIFNGFYDGTKYYFFGSSQYYSGYGSVFTASTGLNFTLQTKTAYIVPQHSAFVNGKYFQTGNEGIVSSGDGINYHYPSGTFYGMASSGSSYVGVGVISSNTGDIYSSNDFNTWTPRAPASQQELYGIAYNGSKYLAVGNNSIIESVDNGTGWTQIATPAATYMSLAWGNSKFVAVGYDVVGANIASSATGLSWTPVNTADNYYFRVKYVNGKFFAMGMNNTDYHGVIMYSADGSSWSDITPVLSFSVYYFNDVVYDGSRFVFMGSDNTNNEFFAVSTSTPANPNSFTNKGTISGAPGGTHLGGDWGNGAFEYSNGHFVGAVNDVANGYKTYVVYSADGITWTASAINETTVIGGIVAQGDVFRMMGTGDGKLTVSFGTLAVNDLRFTGQMLNGQSHLQWQTSTEVNSDKFILQHSTDGHSWTAVASQKAAGNSSSATRYSFIHTTPEQGMNYYRLQQYDLDAAFVYSNTISLLYKPGNGLMVYPNPLPRQQMLQVQLFSAAQVTVYNSLGAVVFNKTLPAGIQQLNLSNLANGIYRLKAGDHSSQLIIQ